jgi:hypothetical protein
VNLRTACGRRAEKCRGVPGPRIASRSLLG